MPALTVSADVYSKIWAVRQPGEETEEQILRRLLNLGQAPLPAMPPAAEADGFIDATYGVHFAEGFEIFRTYKGRAYAARVKRGRWQLDADGRSYDSLNQLSQAVIDGNENAWMFWFTRGPGGGRQKIADLRDPTLVQRRPRRQPKPAGTAPRRPPTTAASQRPAPATMSRPVPAVEAPAAPQTQGGGMPWEPAKRH